LKSKVQKITGNENVKIVFRAYLLQKWIDLRQAKTKMISGPFYTYRLIHTAQMLRFVIICNL